MKKLPLGQLLLCFTLWRVVLFTQNQLLQLGNDLFFHPFNQCIDNKVKCAQRFFVFFWPTRRCWKMPSAADTRCRRRPASSAAWLARSSDGRSRAKSLPLRPNASSVCETLELLSLHLHIKPSQSCRRHWSSRPTCWSSYSPTLFSRT